MSENERVTSVPREYGQTSITISPLPVVFFNSRSCDLIPICRAAPSATTSSGLISTRTFRLKCFSTVFRTNGIRVEPPTMMISVISFDLNPESLIASSTNESVDSTSFRISRSNSSLETSIFRESGAPLFIPMNGRFIFATSCCDN